MIDGLYPALVTPFDAEGRIDAAALQKLVDSCLAKGMDGFYISGSTGESYMLTMAERKYLMDAVAEANAGRGTLLANIGLFATEHSVELAQYAAEKGAAAISSVPPFYFSFTKEEYVQYYNDLAAASDLPVLIYNVPAMSSVRFSVQDIDRFFANDRIIGMKHTSFDLFGLEQIVTRHPDKTIFIGHDEIFLSALATGARSGVGSTYNIMPEKFVRIRQLFLEGRNEEARQVQSQVNNVVDVLCKVGVFKGVKAVLAMQGLDCGSCRRPFLPLSEEQIREVRKVCEENEVL